MTAPPAYGRGPGLDAVARIERLLAAGRRVADPSTSLGRVARRRLVSSSGLSSEGVDLALSEHLEVEPAPEELARLLATVVPVAPGGRAWVLLSAHVVTAALRALALALAAAPVVAIRPSRRDPALAELLVEQLRGDPELARLGGSVELVSDLQPLPGDHVFAYGSDRALEQVSAAWSSGVSRTLFGTGFGVAAIGDGADLGQAAEGLARDVVVFDQRGCLSPRIAFVDGGSDRAEAFGQLLHASLERWGERVPRGEMEREEQAEIAAHENLAACLGTVHCGSSHLVGVDPTPSAAPLPPTGRTVHVVSATASSVVDLMRPHVRYVTAIGAAEARGRLPVALAAACPEARFASLGEMQRPPLDGPADRRGWAGSR